MPISGSVSMANKHPLAKIDWLKRAVEMNKFHISQLKIDPSWTVKQTADALNRSIGSVSQDLLIAQWCKTHEKQLSRCSSMRSALDFIHQKQREQKLGD